MSAGAARRSVDVVHGALREAILEGDLEQGTILSQVQLAERYGVSRTPLREALRLLQGEGLIDALPNRRVQVASFSVDDLEQIYAMRITLESLAVRLSVAQFDADDLRELNVRLAEMDAFAEPRDIDGWNGPHATFHRGLVSHSGARIVALVGQLSETADRYRRLAVTQGDHAWTRVANEHREILDACERREAGEAAQAMARHLARTVLTVVSLVAPEHDPARVRMALASVAAGETASVNGTVA
ncbi:MAG TPA: GntR family transcriptional regulator [Solirubrobacteraceae bacterium]|nr:GntR family transcriptional regulator [Solirubrobacteraceae bacterium]